MYPDVNIESSKALVFQLSRNNIQEQDQASVFRCGSSSLWRGVGGGVGKGTSVLGKRAGKTETR